MAWISVAAAIAAFATSAFAAVSTKCPAPGLCFSLDVPVATLAYATGDILLHITGPTTYTNITLAHHDWTKRHEDYFEVWKNPKYSDIMLRRTTVTDRGEFGGAFERLPGSGVINGMMTAHIRCSNCDTKSGGSMDLTTPARAWKWTYRAANASGHTLESGFLSFDSPASSLSTQSLTGSLLTELRSLHLQPVRRWASSGHAGGVTGPSPRIVHMAMAHGVLACLAWAFIFPLGGILIRTCSFRHLLWVHVCLQIAGLCMYTAAVGLGIQLGLNPWRKWINNKHAIIGLVVYALIVTQAASGYIHHKLFKKHTSRTAWSYVHLWTGRLCIPLAIINAGFGFQLRGQKMGSWKVVLYTVCAVLMWSAYVTSIVVGELRRKKRTRKAVPALGAGISPVDSALDMQTVQENPKQG